MGQHVVEVDQTLARFGALVVPIEPHEQLVRQRRCPISRRLLVTLRRDAPALGPAELIDEVLGGRPLITAGQSPRERRHDPEGIAQDLRQRLAVVAQRPVVAQLRECCRVECPRRHACQAECPHPRDHLARRLVGERDQQDLVCRNGAGGNGVRRAVADDASLAGPGTGQDDDRTGRRHDRLALSVVQTGEMIHAGGALLG